MAAEPIDLGSLLPGEPAKHQAPDEREECYFEKDPHTGMVRMVIRASAIGGCIRNLIAARMGIRSVPFSDDALRRMNEGVIHEPHILARLAEQGWVVDETQSVLEFEMAGGLVIVRGHSDAKVSRIDGLHVQEDRVAECKAMGKDVYAKWKKYQWAEFRRYAWQLSSYMHATGLPGLFAVKNRDSGEIDITYVDEPPVPLLEFKARILKVKAALELPACDPVIWGCQRFFIHEGGNGIEIDPLTGLEKKAGERSKALPPAPHSLPDEAVAAVEELARAYNEARDEETRAKAKKQEVGGFLSAALNHHHLKKAATDRCTVTLVEKTTTSISVKALAEKYPDIALEFTRESKSTYPLVKWKEEEE